MFGVTAWLTGSVELAGVGRDKSVHVCDTIVLD